MKQAESVLLQLHVWMLQIHPGHSSPQCLAMARQKCLKTTRVCNFRMKAVMQLVGILVLQISLLYFAALSDRTVMHQQRYERCYIAKRQLTQVCSACLAVVSTSSPCLDQNLSDGAGKCKNRMSVGISIVVILPTQT